MDTGNATTEWGSVLRPSRDEIRRRVEAFRRETENLDDFETEMRASELFVLQFPLSTLRTDPIDESVRRIDEAYRHLLWESDPDAPETQDCPSAGVFRALRRLLVDRCGQVDAARIRPSTRIDDVVEFGRNLGRFSTAANLRFGVDLPVRVSDRLAGPFLAILGVAAVIVTCTHGFIFGFGVFAGVSTAAGYLYDRIGHWTQVRWEPNIETFGELSKWILRKRNVALRELRRGFQAAADGSGDAIA